MYQCLEHPMQGVIHHVFQFLQYFISILIQFKWFKWIFRTNCHKNYHDSHQVESKIQTKSPIAIIELTCFNVHIKTNEFYLLSFLIRAYFDLTANKRN